MGVILYEPRHTRPNYWSERCSGSEAGSYLRLIDFVYHSTLGLRVEKKEDPFKPLIKKTRAGRSWGR